MDRTEVIKVLSEMPEEAFQHIAIAIKLGGVKLKLDHGFQGASLKSFEDLIKAVDNYFS